MKAPSRHRYTLCFLLFAYPLTLVTHAQESPSSSNGTRQNEETRRMVQILAQAAKTADNIGNPYASETQLALITKLAESAPENRLLMPQEMLNSGRTSEAIELIEQLKKNPRNDTTLTMRLDRLLAISYMRLGEQENCVVNHTSQSCLFPIQGTGVHQLQRGSRNAIEIYKSILQRNPDDLQSRWLLNVAYQTLGQYPDSVPTRWLISPEAFRSEYENVPHFEDVAPQLGIDVEKISGGTSADDFDRDGDIDVMTSSWGTRDQVRYFVNNGDGTFNERTDEAGLTGLTGGLNMVHADYNNDGYVDVMILRGAWLGELGKIPNSLLKNNGDGTFSDVTESSGIISYHPSHTATFGDYNNDGYLDIFVGNETWPQSPLHPCELFMNKGDGTFKEVAKEMKLDIHGFMKGTLWADYDNDNDLDLYISLLGEKNLLFRNNGKGKNGKWSFTEVAEKAGVAHTIYSFPIFIFDYDNDGWQDIFVNGYGLNPTTYMNVDNIINPVVLDYMKETHNGITPRLFRNNQNGTFSDVTKEAHMDRVILTMGCNYGDIDNDGYLDLYMGTGAIDFNALIPNRMFRNAEGKFFQDVTTATGTGHLQKGHGIAFADFDNDGDQDIYAALGGAFPGDIARQALFRNPGIGNNWITIMLEGVQSNRDGLGSRIKITVDRPGGKGKRDIYATVSTGGTFGASSIQQEMGLGDAEKIESISITWPRTGKTQVFQNVAMNQTIRVREGESTVTPVPRKPIVFQDAREGDEEMHHHHH